MVLWKMNPAFSFNSWTQLICYRSGLIFITIHLRFLTSSRVLFPCLVTVSHEQAPDDRSSRIIQSQSNSIQIWKETRFYTFHNYASPDNKTWGYDYICTRWPSPVTWLLSSSFFWNFFWYSNPIFHHVNSLRRWPYIWYIWIY